MKSTLLAVPFETARRYPDRISHKWRASDGVETRTYTQFAHMIRILTGGFAAAGIARGDHVGFFVNNRYEWIATDFALMANGAVSIPRGSDTPAKEVAFIFRHSDSRHLIVENVAQLIDLAGEFSDEDWARCVNVFVVDRPKEGSPVPAPIADRTIFYDELIANGMGALEQEPDLVEKLDLLIDEHDLLTIVYTSGTTGNPKGVRLTHRNFIQNLVANTPRLQIDIDRPEVTVVMLPSWHVYERAFEYCGLSAGLTFVYSSAGRFAADLLAEKPHLLISVPRIWESIYQKLIKAISEMPSAKRRLVMGLIKNNQAWMTSAQYLKKCYVSLHKRSVVARLMAWLWHAARYVLLFPGHAVAGLLFKPFREKVGGRLRLATCGAGSLPKYLDELFNAIGIP
ncbi:MAG: AMP-binding protein, partial [Rectinema sp.]|nr:AMP-binding protein [Rectinema sp.]